MDEFKKGWFSEVSEWACPGQTMSLEVEKVLHKEKSQFQEILIFKRYIYHVLVSECRGVYFIIEVTSFRAKRGTTPVRLTFFVVVANLFQPVLLA